MPEADSVKFITAMTFAVSAVLLVVISYAVHVVISNKHLRLARNKLKALTVRLSSAEEQERRRIAEDLHDRIGETLVVSSRSIEELKHKLASDEANRHLDELSQAIQKFMKGTRSLIFDLIPPALYDFGLDVAVESFAANCRDQYPITIQVETDGQGSGLAPNVAAFLYKAVRELVINAAKHSHGDAATIRLNGANQSYTVVVVDNGVGFDSAQDEAGKTDLGGFGLFNIQVQAEYYGGYLEVDSSRQSGGRVTICVPKNGGAAAGETEAG